MKKETTQYILSRFDTYVASADTKINIFAALSGAWVFGLLSSTDKIVKLLNKLSPNCVYGFMALSIIISLAAVIYCCFAAFPRLPNLGNEANKTVFFFASVAKEDPTRFSERVANIEDSQIEKDIAEQACNLAKVVNGKMKKVRVAIILFLIAIVIIIVPVFLQLVLNVSCKG